MLPKRINFCTSQCAKTQSNVDFQKLFPGSHPGLSLRGEGNEAGRERRGTKGKVRGEGNENGECTPIILGLTVSVVVFVAAEEIRVETVAGDEETS